MESIPEDAAVGADARLERELLIARDLAVAAGAILTRHRAEGLRIRHKGDGEIVTAADLEADALIRDGLREAFPGDALLSEEAHDDPSRPEAARAWIVDPIDGTQDYADGGDEHAISIGLAVEGRPALGVVYNPARGELFTGSAMRALTLADRPARATDVASLADARMTVSGTEWYAGAYGRARSLRIRPLSSAAYKLARVAAGLDDGTFWLWPRKEWDVCAGVALVLAGGGVVTLLDGSPIPFNRRDVRLAGGILAAGASLHPLVRAELVRLGLV